MRNVCNCISKLQWNIKPARCSKYPKKIKLLQINFIWPTDCTPQIKVNILIYYKLKNVYHAFSFGFPDT